MIDKNTSYYIAVRGVEMGSNLTGGPYVNTDDRLWNNAGSPFVLSLFRNGSAVHYAVSDSDAEEFIGRVLRQSGEDEGKDRIRSGPGRAEVRIGMLLHPFRDADLLRRWLEELRDKCGESLSEAELHRYTHPAPLPPAGAVEVTKIVEQAVLPYRSPAVLGPGPDNCRSELLAEGDFAVLSVFQDGMHLEYLLPPALLPEVNAAARELLDHPADGYHPEWDADAWLKVKGREEEFDAEPEEVLKLFESLAGRCGDPIPRKERMDFYKVYLPSVRKKLDAAWDCPLCAWTRNTGGYCQGCGAKKEDVSSEQAVSAPKPRAESPWRCNGCGAEGNAGGYCAECGRAYDYPPLTGRTSFGYRKGQSMFGGFGMMRPGMMGGFAPAQNALKESAPPSGEKWYCTECGMPNTGRFCTECGKARYG